MTHDELESQVRAEGNGVLATVRKKIVSESPEMRLGLQLYVGDRVSGPIEETLGWVHRRLIHHLKAER